MAEETDMERFGRVTGDLSAENAEALKGQGPFPKPPLGQPPIEATTVRNIETMSRLLRITCGEHDILSETTWRDEELQSANGDRSPMQAYLEHVVGAHREPYGANCSGQVDVNLYDGDRAPVTVVWRIGEFTEFAPTLIGVFATPGDAEQWIGQQREPNGIRFEQQDFNVLHYLPTSEPTEEPTAP